MDSLRGFFVALLLWKTVCSVRIEELRVPAHVAAGGEAMLGCDYDLEGDILYSLKWYKDGREFYKYLPGNRPPATNFAMDGVEVDMSRSSNGLVTLVDIQPESAGHYSCEVSGEAPAFMTVVKYKDVTVDILPETGPHATGLKRQYSFGERLVANCSSSASRPPAQLRWLINGRAASPGQLRGPYERITDSLDMAETTLQLRVAVKVNHFVNGVMVLKCQATIPPLYHQETTHLITNPQLSPTMTTLDDLPILTDLPPPAWNNNENLDMPAPISGTDVRNADAHTSGAAAFAKNVAPLSLIAIIFQILHF